MTRPVATLLVILHDMGCHLWKSTVDTKCLSIFFISSDLLSHREAEVDNSVDKMAEISATLLLLEGIVYS